MHKIWGAVCKSELTHDGVDIGNANTTEVSGGSCVQGHPGLHRGIPSQKLNSRRRKLTDKHEGNEKGQAPRLGSSR